MQYREVPKIGRELSILSYGCMRFIDDETAAKAVKRAVELGVNYFDVAPGYCGSTAEPRLALGLAQCDKSGLFVTAKSSPGSGGPSVGNIHQPEIGFGILTADQARKQIELSMEILGVDHLQAYHLWAVHDDCIFDEAIKPGGFLEGVASAHKDGLIDTIGITTHMHNESIIRYLNEFDFTLVTLPFHLLDTSRAEAVAYCAERGIGVIAMNPLVGGKLAQQSPVLQNIASDLGFDSMAEAALRYVAFYPGITTALNGIASAENAESSAAFIEKGPIPEDIARKLEARINEFFANVEHLCTACGYCGECPQEIFIPEVLDLYTGLLVPSTEESARASIKEKLARNEIGYSPSKCIACKICESKCPNKLPVSELMMNAANRWG